MDLQRIGDDVFLRLDQGEEIHTAIQSLAEHGITTAAITSGIGRVRDIEVGFLDSTGIYQTVIHTGPMELVSTQGNLAPSSDGPFTHIHSIFSDDNHVVHGGHLITATIEVVAEIHLRVLNSQSDDPMERVKTENDFVRLSFCNLR